MRFDKAFAPVQERISLVLMFSYNGVPCRFQIARTHKIFPFQVFSSITVLHFLYSYVN